MPVETTGQRHIPDAEGRVGSADNGIFIHAIVPRHVEPVAHLRREEATHSMNLTPAPFEMIKSGEKTIELRLFDEKRQKIKPGDTIVFTNTETAETLETAVAALHRFDSFEELYKSLPLLKCGYTEETVSEAKPADMEFYYSVDAQKKYGVVGIEISLPKETADKNDC